MPLSQIRGAFSNAANVIRTVSLTDLLPPSWVSTILFIRDSLPRALGFSETVTQQITGVIVLTIVMVIVSIGILTPIAIGFFAIFFPIALLRLVPAVNSRWRLSSSSWPLWEVR